MRVAVDGCRRPLPPAVDLAAFRVVQESLTNVLKHAQASRATVCLRYGAGAVDVEVADDGTGSARGLLEDGHGLLGMRERVALHGGSVEWGRRANGGFRVRARLPVGDLG